MLKIIATVLVSGALAFGLAGCQKEESAVKDAETKVEQTIGAKEGEAKPAAEAPKEQPAENKPAENKPAEQQAPAQPAAQ